MEEKNLKEMSVEELQEMKNKLEEETKNIWQTVQASGDTISKDEEKRMAEIKNQILEIDENISKRKESKNIYVGEKKESKNIYAGTVTRKEEMSLDELRNMLKAEQEKNNKLKAKLEEVEKRDLLEQISALQKENKELDEKISQLEANKSNEDTIDEYGIIHMGEEKEL